MRSEFPPAPTAARLLNLREVQEEFGLSVYAIYSAAQEGRLHAVQRGDNGRHYYAEWEVRELLRFLYRLSAAA